MHMGIRVISVSILLIIVAGAIIIPVVLHFRNGESDDDDEDVRASNLTTTITRSTTRSTTRAGSTNANSNTTRPITTTQRGTTSTAPTSNVTLYTTTYESSFTDISSMYCRVDPCTSGLYFFEALQITVNVTGIYSIQSDSSLDTYGYLYNNTFNPGSVRSNLLQEDDDGAGSRQFSLSSTLNTANQYIIVATTYNSQTRGTFAIASRGPGSTTFVRLDISVSSPNTSSTQTVSTAPTPPPPPSTTTATTTTVESTVSSEITDSAVYCRTGATCGAPNFFYRSIHLNVSITGTYTISSVSNFDTYGSLYNNSFNPSTPSANLISANDDGPSNTQFQLVVFLQSLLRYVLVVSTYSPAVTGSFSVVAVGDGSASFSIN